MTYQISPELKPLSANLKRLEIGEILSDRDFELNLEEYRWDELWDDRKKFHYNNRTVGFFKAEEYTQILILCIQLIYDYYKEDIKFKNKFNDFIFICFLYFISRDRTKKDYSKILENLRDLEIVTVETINDIIKCINSKVYKEAETINPSKITITTNKKYQIFISSTYIDLIEERQAAVEEILKKGHIPAGMELFTANNKTQWEVITKWIDDSDIYVLLLGGRYGSIDNKTGLSYTEMEYDYAIKNNKSFFALILDDEILNKKPTEIKIQHELTNPKYIEFKQKVKTKMSSFPKNKDQIKNHINHSLDTIIKENNEKMSGWIKGN